MHALGVVRKRVMPFRLGQARGASCLSTGEEPGREGRAGRHVAIVSAAMQAS